MSITGLVTVLYPPQSEAFATLDTVKANLNLTDTDAARDAWLEDRIADASAAITEYIDRPYILRQRVKERFSGTGRTNVLLETTPIMSIELVEHSDAGVVYDKNNADNSNLNLDRIFIHNAEAGIVFRESGWPDNAPIHVWLAVDRLEQDGRAPWQATYVGGYLTHNDDIVASGYSVAAITASGTSVLTAIDDAPVMPLVVPGEIVRLRGFANRKNNGRFIVRERTDETIVLNGLLTDETAPGGSSVEVATLPSTLERCVVEAVKNWYLRKVNPHDPEVVSEHIGDWSAQFASGRLAGADITTMLPPDVLRAIEPYVRMM
jgi:hypothetical protein